jgi:hypothetical protein
MGSKLKCLIAVTVGVLMLFTMLVFTACVSSTSGRSGFPTGRFVHEQFDWYVFEFDEDGAYRYFMNNLEVPLFSGKYGVNGDLYTEMTNDHPENPKVPVTYFWTFDGKNLMFELWGKDVNFKRKRVYDNQTYVNVE